jgi:hypothetical protein
MFPRLVQLFILGSPQFAQWLREQAAQLPAELFSPLTEEQVKSKMEGFERELYEIEQETKRQEILGRQALVDEELAALEQKD